MLSLSEYKHPVNATVLCILFWYYLLIVVQRSVKYKLVNEYKAKGKTFDRYFGQDPRMLSVDRVVANTQEQMMPFLVSLWLHAVFVNPDRAGYLGYLYLLARLSYRFLMPASLQNIQPKYVYVATGPSYAVVAYLTLSTFRKALTA